MTSNGTILIVLLVLAAAAAAYIFLTKRAQAQALIADTGGAATPTLPTDPTGWRLGPVVYGINLSIGSDSSPIVLRPSAPDGIVSFDIPVGTGQPKDATGHPQGGQVHALTYDNGPLTGAKGLRAKFRIDLPAGVTIIPVTAPAPNPAEISLFFQEKGDNYSAAGQYETFRWYSSAETIVGVVDGVHEVVAPFDGRWTPTIAGSEATDPVQFQAAIDNAQAVGLVFGGGDGLAHGFYASGPGAKFTLLEFEVTR